MESDPLAQLLRQADRAAGGALPVRGDLSQRVRRLAGRRRRIALGEGLLVACLAVAFTAWAAQRLPGQRGASTAEGGGLSVPPTGSLADQLIAMQTAAERLRDEIVAAGPAVNTSDLAAAGVSELTPVGSLLEQELERAAYLIVYQAERYHRELGLPDSAIASYRETIELFPRTRAAETARVRLARLENTERSQS